ncbi:MAG: hypothetical protein GY710_21945 [Desulfobacteraceae bacterium]|nr:hypothetical protein [Desulfobacteraceae bacterium]
MIPLINTEGIREKLVIKAVRNIRKNFKTKEEEGASMYREGISLDLSRSRLLTQSYKETEGKPMVLRRAWGLEKILEGMDLYIQDWEVVVGSNVSSPEGLFFGIDMNWRSVKRVCDSKAGRSLLDDEGRKELAKMSEYWNGRSISDIQREKFSGDVLDYWKMSKGAPVTWSHWSHLGIPDYEKLFKLGVKGFIKKACDRLVELDKTVPLDYIDQKEFLQAVIITLKAVITFANRYSDLAKKKAEETIDPTDKKRLEHIAKVCAKVPEHPPKTFIEALQSFYFIHLARSLEFSSLGIGLRFDKIFGPYFDKDVKEGRITRKEAMITLQLLWVKIHDLGLIYSPTLSSIYGGVASLQAVTLGGVDENANDVTNEMSYMVLETAKLMQTPEPTIALRYHDYTPRELLSAATDVIKTGVGYPSLFNDKSMIPLMKNWDVPQEHATDYAISGCVYLELPGKNISNRAVGGIILPGALLYGLSQGINPMNGEQIGAKTPDPKTFKSVDDVMDAYLTQVDFFFNKLCTIDNISKSLYEKYIPRPFYSAFLEGCIEKGKDTSSWGYPSAISDICIVIGPTNVSDSITAIKKNVFDDKKITMEELLTAMAHNWVGYEDIQQMMINAPKYGNDDDYADFIAAQTQERTAKAMMNSTNRFGYPCRGDGSGISGTYAAGSIMPATPEGRKAGEPFADATLSPVFGMDTKGPTAVLKSASKINTTKTHNHLMNQKFLPSALEGNMKEVFIDYIRSWGDLNINQIQFNVVDSKTLKKAQENPEEHKDLLVRVAGYSAYFVDLSKGLQDSIITRTAQGF